MIPAIPLAGSQWPKFDLIYWKDEYQASKQTTTRLTDPMSKGLPSALPFEKTRPTASTSSGSPTGVPVP